MIGIPETGFWNFLARRLPWLGTPGLIKTVVVLNALMFVLLEIDPAYETALTLVPEKILQGEVWRLVTYIFIPETRSFFWILFALLFLWFLSTALEDLWGALKLNVFYLTGMIGCTVAAFFFDGGPSNTFLNLSLFFAFATIVPDYEIFLFFLVRLKIKYVAWGMAFIFGLQFIVMPAEAKMAMAVSLANYLLFFGPGFVAGLRSPRGRKGIAPARFARAAAEPLHRCATCGRTELSDPALEFRVTDSGDEYCLDHLPTR